MSNEVKSDQATKKTAQTWSAEQAKPNPKEILRRLPHSGEKARLLKALVEGDRITNPGPASSVESLCADSHDEEQRSSKRADYLKLMGKDRDALLFRRQVKRQAHLR
ncbi:hypothetical protein N7468_007233 [Penicillium chermesinum]|uniref:Uncharacterized protein n=1 Tax=Penicillium chermesinum TaxID=63820 RepID=A0A9W9TKG6_9EURO|nr:uncharacterized protein N7468_007233 [Penicillium chermesinum]KAJ5226008.1 hypothetical protein N7468_007233 [Penicillium chermesinum]KAJ6160795.1 hypothetical protein N7470_004191 [Penicillium chermesinum]